MAERDAFRNWQVSSKIGITLVCLLVAFIAAAQGVPTKNSHQVVFHLATDDTLVHKNLVRLENDPNDIYSLGIGGRLKLSKRIAFTWDYFYVFNPLTDNVYTNPLSVGLDIETGGHVFQLHFSNAVGMNEPTFITETTGDWSKGEIRFGFNLSRVFQLKKKKLD